MIKISVHAKEAVVEMELMLKPSSGQYDKDQRFAKEAAVEMELMLKPNSGYYDKDQRFAKEAAVIMELMLKPNSGLRQLAFMLKNLQLKWI